MSESKKKIRVGIIGLGKMGISHCAIVGAHPDAELVSVCDSSSLVTAAFKKYSKFECFSDYRKMINNMSLDAIIIAAPTSFHQEMVSYALEHDINVFCEKPLLLNFVEGKKLSSFANQKSLINQV